MSSPSDRETVTELLRQSNGGNRDALDRLLPLVYDELRAMARNRLRAERDDHTLQTTALVHETYLKLVRDDRTEWRSRAHFFALGAQAMRRVLVDYARAKGAARRGGGAERVPLDSVEAADASMLSPRAASEVVALDDALSELQQFDERAARVVEYRFFGGLKHVEIASVLGVSEVTVRRSWTAARAWLRREMGDVLPDSTGPGLTLDCSTADPS